jgi:hypothetical protein
MKTTGLANALRKGVVHFRYTKLDGTIREAVGTLKSDMLPPMSGGGRPTPDCNQLYFDVEKQSYRSFRKDNLLDYQEAICD